MHTYIFACLFVFALVSADPREEIKKVHEKCQSDPTTSIDHAILEKFEKGEAVTDPNIGKHFLCMHVEEGIQSQNGDIKVDKLREIIGKVSHNQEKIEEIISKCGTRTSTNAEEAAVGLTKCLHEFRPAHGDHAGHHHHH